MRKKFSLLLQHVKHFFYNFSAVSNFTIPTSPDGQNHHQYHYVLVSFSQHPKEYGQELLTTENMPKNETLANHF